MALVLGRFRERGERIRGRVGVVAIFDAFATRKIGVRVEGVGGIVRDGRSGTVVRVVSHAVRRVVAFRETRDDAVAREGVALVRILARERLARDEIRVVAVREDVLAGRARVVQGEEERCQWRGETGCEGGREPSAAKAHGARSSGRLACRVGGSRPRARRREGRLNSPLACAP